MKTQFRVVAIAAFFAIASAAALESQEPAASTTKAPVTPLKVTVTISRHLGDKRVSSLPYTLSANIAGSGTGVANLRIGTRVPVTAATTSTPREGAAGATVTYQDVGTSIDCFAFSADETGRFRLQISIDESSVYEDPAAKGPIQVGRPTFRSFRTGGSLMLKDGQSAEMSNTPDRMTGESVRVDVALAVVK